MSAQKAIRTMKKKLLVILGAGSSADCGMPFGGKLETLIEEWSDGWAKKRQLSNHYRTLRESIGKYYCSGAARPRPILNFEKVLGEMIALSHWMTPPPFGDPLRQIACNGAPPPDLRFAPAPALWAGAIEVTDQLTHLLIKLARHFRLLCANTSASSEAFVSYRALVSRLSNAFDVGIYNLNYDTLAKSAWPQAFTGFDDEREFDAAAVHSRQEWGFVYHLHGSVHHSLSAAAGEGPIVWRGDLKADFNDGDPSNPPGRRSEGKSFPNTTLVAGGLKLDQLLVEPFHSLHSALVRHAYKADAILIGGYGFGDEHINRALMNRLKDRTMERPRPPVMVLDKATGCAEPTFRRDDFWATELARTLQAPLNSFQGPGAPQLLHPPSVLAASGAFEVSRGCALWHGGFVEATSRLDSIVAWLSTADESVLVPNTSGV
jgi:hypothetical protein